MESDKVTDDHRRRPGAIKKFEAWWGLAQDERREIFESRSMHISANMKYLPAIARQLFHARDIGGEFDFFS